jgi:hypothetical protein
MLAEIQNRERSRILSPDQVAAVRVELNSILASPTFSGSKRCQDFLECIVKHALAGDYDELSERFLGVELFGRKVDFDTGADSIVRVRASDVRRRLAQYYSERSSPSAVIIGLSSGTYVPTFQWHVAEDKKESVLNAFANDELPPAPADLSQLTALSGVRSYVKPWPIVFSLVVLIALVATGWHFWSVDHNGAVDEFWGPYLRGKAKVVLCFGDSHVYWLAPDLRQKVDDKQLPMVVQPGQIGKTGPSPSTGDVRGIMSLASLLNGRGVATEALWPQESNNIALDRANVIYIGGFNNFWTMNLNRNLRFFFDSIPGEQGPIWFIRDRAHPDKRWMTEKIASQQTDHSYALVTRIIDPDRRRVQLAIGGIGAFGTQGACQFLIDSAALSEFARNAPHGWQDHNLQLLLEMDISGAVVVNPKVVDFQVW